MTLAVGESGFLLREEIDPISASLGRETRFWAFSTISEMSTFLLSQYSSPGDQSKR